MSIFSLQDADVFAGVALKTSADVDTDEDELFYTSAKANTNVDVKKFARISADVDADIRPITILFSLVTDVILFLNFSKQSFILLYVDDKVVL